MKKCWFFNSVHQVSTRLEQSEWEMIWQFTEKTKDITGADMQKVYINQFLLLL